MMGLGERLPPRPNGSKEIRGDVFDADGDLIEIYDGKWLKVVNADRLGWWRFHEHYDRSGYCDNPGRGY